MKISIRKIKRITFISVTTIVFIIFLFMVQEVSIITRHLRYKKPINNVILLFKSYNILVSKGTEEFKKFIKNECENPPPDFKEGIDIFFIDPEGINSEEMESLRKKIIISSLIVVYSLALGSIIFLLLEIFKIKFVKVRRPFK